MPPGQADPMRYAKDQITAILLPASLRDAMISHCQGRLRGGGNDMKAFGLLGGTVTASTLTIASAVPLHRNARACGGQKTYMDSTMERHAVPSVTPLDQRGWVAEPGELDSALATLHSQGVRLVGNYHMHRVAWAHDPLRDTPTELDTVLGKASRMFMFIISMVTPEAPIIRAFFEGNLDLEAPVIII